MNYDWMNAYLVTTKKVPGLYALVMIFDNPTYQIPDEDVLDDLVKSLMKDYPEYSQSGETKYGTDDKRPKFSFSEFENMQSDEKLSLILAGNKKTLVYLWLAYPSEDAVTLYKPVMNEIASSLTIL